jgi:HK97 family phage major capsid protein
MSGGSSLTGNEGLAFGSRSFASTLKSGRVPRLVLSEETTKALFDAATTKQAMRIETKAAMDAASLLPAQLLPGIVGFAHEPVRILDHIPATPMSGPSVDFIAHTSTTGAPGMVAKGGAKPEVEFNLVASILTARKIAGWCSLFDEDLLDFPQFTSYLQNELVRVTTDVENTQVLTGDGTGQNLLGLLNVSGILTRAKGADTNLDAMEQAIADLRTGPAFCEPDAVVIHPTSWSIIRRSKDSQNRYLLNPDPSSIEANTL